MKQWELYNKLFLRTGFTFVDELTSGGSDTSIMIYRKVLPLKQVEFRIWVAGSGEITYFSGGDFFDDIESFKSWDILLKHYTKSHQTEYRKIQLENILDE